MHATIHTGVRASQVTARRARVLCRCSVYQWKPITVNSTIHEIISDGRETRNRNQEKEKKENVVEEFPSRRASSFELILFRVPLVNSSQPLNRSTVTIFVAFYLFVILMVLVVWDYLERVEIVEFSENREILRNSNSIDSYKHCSLSFKHNTMHFLKPWNRIIFIAVLTNWQTSIESWNTFRELVTTKRTKLV